MRTKFIVGCPTKKAAEEWCIRDGFTPAVCVKVTSGYMCFESAEDYRIWKGQK